MDAGRTDVWRYADGQAGHPYDDPAVAEILKAPTMTLATAEAAGGPHAAPVFFAADAALQLVFFSGPASLHVRHALADPRVSAAIYPDVADWTQIHGLQLDGALRRIPPGPDWDRAWGIYLRKFPFAAELRAIVERSSLLIFVPTWVRLVDNRRGFGFRREWRRVA